MIRLRFNFCASCAVRIESPSRFLSVLWVQIGLDESIDGVKIESCAEFEKKVLKIHRKT